MAKGKSTFIEFRCPITGARLKTTTINKSKLKMGDLAAKLRIFSKTARQRVTPIAKEIKRSK
jgi:hypothetical protein